LRLFQVIGWSLVRRFLPEKEVYADRPQGSGCLLLLLSKISNRPELAIAVR
jgi:hypothetical protein